MEISEILSKFQIELLKENEYSIVKKQPKGEISKIIEVVNDYYNTEITSKTRVQKIVFIRQNLISLLFNYGYSNGEISKAFKFHHATVIHSNKMAQNHIEMNYRPFVEIRKEIIKVINSNFL